LAPLNLVGPGTLRVDANGVVSVLLDPLGPAIVTPHNLTSNTSNGDFIVNGSSTSFNDIGNYGPWRCFDEAGPQNGIWGSGNNTYSSGVQITSAVAPMPTPGSWIAATFSSDKVITKLRYKSLNAGIPADFSVARFDGTAWIDSGFSVTNATQFPETYIEYIIPAANGGGGLWRGIAFIISRIYSWDSNNNVYLRELDFQ
jgi:hypothetical protein